MECWNLVKAAGSSHLPRGETAGEKWWKGLDSNQCTLAWADLQSAAFNHSATLPQGCFVEARAPNAEARPSCQRTVIMVARFLFDA